MFLNDFTQECNQIVELWNLMQSLNIKYPLLKALLIGLKYSDGHIWSNSVDPEWAAWSGLTLFTIPSASFWRITVE